MHGEGGGESGGATLLVEILGREDAQVKLNGFRVELGEIDIALVRHPRVHAAVTTVHHRASLVSYVVLRPPSTPPGTLAVTAVATYLRCGIPFVFVANGATCAASGY
mgnify:CR=1 FL=1